MLRPACYVALVGISCFFLSVGASPFRFQFNESFLSLKELTTSIYNVTEETTEHADEHSGGHSTLALAGWNYDYVAVPLDISLFILFAGLVKISKSIYICRIGI